MTIVHYRIPLTNLVACGKAKERCKNVSRNTDDVNCPECETSHTFQREVMMKHSVKENCPICKEKAESPVTHVPVKRPLNRSGKPGPVAPVIRSEVDSIANTIKCASDLLGEAMESLDRLGMLTAYERAQLLLAMDDRETKDNLLYAARKLYEGIERTKDGMAPRFHS